MLGALVGLVVRQFRSRTSLIAENELLRQQLAAAKSRLQRKRVMFISTISSCLAKAIFCASSRSTPASTTSLGHTRASGRNSLCLECPRLTVVSWHFLVLLMAASASEADVVRLFEAIDATLGTVRRRRESQVQNLRKPARCHWITVSGFTKTSTSDHLAHSPRKVTQEKQIGTRHAAKPDRYGLERRAAAGEPGSQSRDQRESGARRGRSRREVERGGA